MFIIEDELHAELQGKFESFEDAMNELKARSKIPWDKYPNVVPCTNWRNCGREYVIVEYDMATKPWTEISRTPVLSVSSKGVSWENE